MHRRTLLAAGAALLAGVRPRAATALAGADFHATIHEAADRHGTDGNWLIDVMYCESHGDPRAYNPATGDSGLYQYQPQTFWRFAELSGIAVTDVWNPWEQIELTAWAFGAGYCDHWVCGCWDGSPS